MKKTDIMIDIVSISDEIVFFFFGTCLKEVECKLKQPLSLECIVFIGFPY